MCIVYLDCVPFQIIMDNVDKMFRARHMTIGNRNKDYHWCNAYAVRNRITAGYNIYTFDSDMYEYILLYI